MSAAPVLILPFHPEVGQVMATFLGKNVGARALEVEHGVVVGVVMWISADGAGLPLDRLAGELKHRRPAGLAEGAGLADTLEAWGGAGALLCTGVVTPEGVSHLNLKPWKNEK